MVRELHLGSVLGSSAFAMVLEMDQELDDGACSGVEGFRGEVVSTIYRENV